jgi:hypothetical protein
MSDKKKLSELENKFNLVIIGMIEHITNYHSDTKIKLLSGIVKKLILKKPSEPISYFLLHIYRNDEYRTHILNGNDVFFMNYDVKNVGKSNMINHIFEFKNIWGKLEDESKTYIKKAMKALVLIGQKYVLSI